MTRKAYMQLVLLAGFLATLFCTSDLNPIGLNVCRRAVSVTETYQVTVHYTASERYKTCCGWNVWILGCWNPCHKTRYVSRARLDKRTRRRYRIIYECCSGYRQEGRECPIAICDDTCINGKCNAPNVCTCNDGFDGGTCSEDINECEINNGGCNQNCLNTAGSYQCDCFEGFIYNSATKECKDKNECLNNNGNCSQYCFNERGSYRCGCRIGYTLEEDARYCKDINECETLNGGCGHLCKNNIGSYVCECNGGFFLDGNGKTCSADCPAGTKYDGVSKCEDCPLHHYQDQQAQSSCKPCPKGYMTETVRSVSIHQCQLPATTTTTTTTSPTTARMNHSTLPTRTTAIDTATTKTNTSGSTSKYSTLPSSEISTSPLPSAKDDHKNMLVHCLVAGIVVLIVIVAGVCLVLIYVTMIRRPAKSSHKYQERGTVMQNQAYEPDFNTFEKKDPAIQGAAGSPYNEEPLYEEIYEKHKHFCATDYSTIPATKVVNIPDKKGFQENSSRNRVTVNRIVVQNPYILGDPVQSP